MSCTTTWLEKHIHCILLNTRHHTRDASLALSSDMHDAILITIHHTEEGKPASKGGEEPCQPVTGTENEMATDT